MFIQIAPKGKVYISKMQMQFILRHCEVTFKNTDLAPQDVETAKLLADKAIFVRKKLDIGVQYALNKRIRIVPNANKK